MGRKIKYPEISDFDRSKESKFWEIIAYPDSINPKWKDLLDQWNMPGCYILHDKDIDYDKSVLETGEIVLKEPHYHIMLMYNDKTTFTNMYGYMLELGGKRLDKIIFPVSTYNYLIHDTKKAREQKKHLYDKSERIEFNDFDIEDLPLTSKSIKEMNMKIIEVIKTYKITSYYQLLEFTYNNKDLDELNLQILGHTYLYTNIIKEINVKRKTLKEQYNRFIRAGEFYDDTNDVLVCQEYFDKELVNFKL